MILRMFSWKSEQVLQNDIDLLNPPAELEKLKHKKKRLVQSPNSFFMVCLFIHDLFSFCVIGWCKSWPYAKKINLYPKETQVLAKEKKTLLQQHMVK